MENLKWTPVPGFEKYEVNEMLQVRHRVSKKIKSCYTHEGYLRLNLHFNNGKKCNRYLHQVIGWAFVPNPENKPELHHIDEDKLNNYPPNLMWVTKKEHREISRLNEQIGFKVSRKDVVYIRDNYSDEKKKELALQFGVTPTRIYNIAIHAARSDIKEGKIHEPLGFGKKIISIETGEIFKGAEMLSERIGIKTKEIHRQLNGERYCHIPYRYIGGEDKVRFMPPPKPKKEKPPKKERPPRKVYVPHPAVYRKMIAYDLNGKEVQIFDSSGEAADFVKSNADTFRKAIKRSPNNFTKGYVWKYA